MALKQRLYAITVGVPAQLQQAASEDIQHVMTFTDAPATLGGTGEVIDLTGMTSFTLTAIDAQGAQLFQVTGSIVGDPTLGAAGFTVLHTALTGKPAQGYAVDGLLIDSGGHRNQALVASVFQIVRSVT